MKPILYAPGETNFGHNGIGTLAETTSCTVSEERNGAFELELKYPVNGRLYRNIEEGCIVKAKPNDISDPQLFYIYRSTKPLDGFVTFYGEHISYELSGNPVEGVEVVDEIAQNAMQQIFAAALLPHPYTAYSDITTRNGTSIKRASLRAALGGVEGSMLSVWGGEYEFDNFTVKLHSARGRETGIKIAYGKNLTDLQQEKNISEVYCGVFPYAKYTPQPTEGGTEQPEEVAITLSEKIVWSPHAASYARKRVCIKDFSDRFNGADGITEEQLREVVEAWVETSGFDVPAVSITVSFVNLWNSPEYAKYALLERVNLCDTVSVDFPKLGVSATAKIVKTKYDVLNEKYLTLTLGSVKANFADTVNQTSAAIAQTKQEIKDTSAAIEVDIKKAVDEATQAITGQSGGYVVLNPPKNPQEILIMDAPTIAEAKKIWRWNSGGLGYSKNGYNGPFGTAITQDGAIVADYITVGKVGALNIDVEGVIRAGSLAVLGDVEIEAKRATDAESTLSSRISANATAITAKVSSTGGIKSSFAWSLTSSGFTLTAGNVNVMKVTSSGLEVTGKITAKSGSLENLSIAGRLTFGGNSSYYIDANKNDDTYYINLPGLRIDDASGAVFSGSLSAATGTFAGSLSAATGTFAGSLSAATGTFSGELVAATGKVGGWTIGTTTLHSVTTAGVGTGFQIQTSGIWAIAVGFTDMSSWATAPFRVNHSGEMYAANATIEGTISNISGNNGVKIISNRIEFLAAGETIRIIPSTGFYNARYDDTVNGIRVDGAMVCGGDLILGKNLGFSDGNSFYMNGTRCLCGWIKYLKDSGVAGIGATTRYMRFVNGLLVAEAAEIWEGDYLRQIN